MTPHWSARYVGRPYVHGTGDCAALAAQVQADVFGRAIRLPVERARGLRALTAQIESLRDDYAVRTAAPSEGDAVLMISRGRLEHLGVYCRVDGEPYVLHAMRNAGQVCLHRLRDLPRLGLAIEGYYRWL